MSVADAVRAARSPQDALLAVAEGLDALAAKLDAAPAADSWGEWSSNSPAVQADRSPHESAVPDNTAAISAVEAELLATTDPEDVQALEARLRLLRDDGRSVDVRAPAGSAPTIVETDDTATVVIPAPSPAKAKARRIQARMWELHNFLPLTETEALAAYAQGGPHWLYGYDRDAVMQMPFAWRQAMVEDVLQDSPRAAHEMGRDILKSQGTGNPDVAGTLLDVNIGGEA